MPHVWIPEGFRGSFPDFKVLRCGTADFDRKRKYSTAQGKRQEFFVLRAELTLPISADILIKTLHDRGREKKMTDYELLCRQAEELLKTEPWYVPAFSNLSALLMDSLPELNWAGFYILRGERLVVGPFQGKPACVHIPVGKGVCGTCIGLDRVQNVPDVHAFPGHIACDSASNSEIVLPLHRGGRPAAVLDIDSPVPGRFSGEDEAGLKRLAGIIEARIVWEEKE